MNPLMLFNRNPARAPEVTNRFDDGEPPRIPRFFNPANGWVGLPNFNGAFGATLDIAVIPHNYIDVVRGPETVSGGLFGPHYADGLQIPAAIMSQAWTTAQRGPR